MLRLVPSHGQKWRDLCDDLRSGIATGTYRVGTALPSIPELMAAGVGSDSTIKRALRQLVDEGLIEARHGSGHWVIRATPVDDTERRLAEVERRVGRIEQHLQLDNGSPDPT